LSETDKWHWLDLCDIFIMPARDIDGDLEGFGIVYLEAALAGKPVIAGRSGGVTDAVLDDRTGLLVNPEKTGEIAQAIIKLAQYQGLRQRLGDQARQRALTDFNWQKLAKKVQAIINH
jgi:phosphatidylinositol alpha-1,6-mannosyltransferase